MYMDMYMEWFVPVVCPAHGNAEFEIVWHRPAGSDLCRVVRTRIVTWDVPSTVSRHDGPSGNLDMSEYCCPYCGSGVLLQCHACSQQSCQPVGKAPWCAYCDMELQVQGSIQELKGHAG